ncbi:MAG: manganese ABC transporter ATP-binding protein [Myxococcales bacterium]|nr:manganese ABC transporter ATP-binding protein [Myxococcales bacterium]
MRAATTTPALEVRDMTISYDREPVVEGVTLTIPQGRVVGILGPNGAGKSTLIKGVLGLLETDHGEVRVFGGELSGSRQEVVYVPQRGSVDWDFPVTVKDVVLMGRYGRLGLFGRPSAEDRRIAWEAMAKMGIEALADRQISEMSGGQQQRVFLARALAQEGRLLFMDEPFVGVDASTEAAIVELLHEMRDQGRTVVVVNHDLQTAREYFDELILLNKRLIAYGPVKQVFTAPLLSKTYGGRLAVFRDHDDQEIIVGA